MSEQPLAEDQGQRQPSTNSSSRHSTPNSSAGEKQFQFANQPAPPGTERWDGAEQWPETSLRRLLLAARVNILEAVLWTGSRTTARSSNTSKQVRLSVSRERQTSDSLSICSVESSSHEQRRCSPTSQSLRVGQRGNRRASSALLQRSFSIFLLLSPPTVGRAILDELQQQSSSLCSGTLFSRLRHWQQRAALDSEGPAIPVASAAEQCQ